MVIRIALRISFKIQQAIFSVSLDLLYLVHNFRLMDFRKKLSILVITGYLFIEVFLLCGLFTNEWIRTNEYNLGLRRYCNDTKHDTSCQNVHDVVDNILPNRKCK